MGNSPTNRKNSAAPIVQDKEYTIYKPDLKNPLKIDDGVSRVVRGYESSDEKMSLYVMKIVSDQGSDRKTQNALYKAFKITQGLTSPFTVRVHDITRQAGSQIVVYEYCEEGDLVKYLKNLKEEKNVE